MAKEKPDGLPVELSCLIEAQSLVYGDRNRDYGHPYDDYERVTAIFNAMTGNSLTPSEGVKFMLAVKLSRMHHKVKRDNYVDLAGYTEVLRVVEEREHAGRVSDH